MIRRVNQAKMFFQMLYSDVRVRPETATEKDSLHYEDHLLSSANKHVHIKQSEWKNNHCFLFIRRHPLYTILMLILSYTKSNLMRKFCRYISIGSIFT